MVRGKNANLRIYFINLGIIIIGAAIISRLFSLQVLQGDTYKALAEGQHQLYQKLLPERGEIFAQSREGTLYPLAINKNWPYVYAVPKKIDKSKREDTARSLAELLDMDEKIIMERISKENDPYEPLKHKISDETAQKIKDMKIQGIKISEEQGRFYPGSTLAAHVVGFLGFIGDERQGQYGLEGHYNKELSGTPGFLEAEKDTAGRWIPLTDRNLVRADDGVDLILTIDQNIQFYVEDKLQEIADKWSADKGNIIIMDPATGAVKAMANYPSFDPNNYAEVENIDIFLNSSIHDQFEPGSVFKPVTMAAALDLKKVNPDTTYNDAGVVKIGKYSLRNSDNKSHGIQTMTQILEKSLNTGAIYVQQLVGKDNFYEYVKKFGFGVPSGIDLAGEVEGNIANLKKNSDIHYATASFGQGIAVTPIQMINALSAIANNGKLMRPYIVDRMVDADGKETVTAPQVIRQVFSEETARRLSAMLVSVVENGYSKRSRLDRYYLAAKTGTAQVPNRDRPGYSEETIHSVIGFAPAFDPKFVMMIKLDNPKGIRFAAGSIAPLFGEISEFLVNYYEIPPDR